MDGFPNFGVVFFDNPECPEQGYASEAGGIVFRIASIGDLKSDVVWVTNLEYEQMSRFNLWRNPKLKRCSFFRENLYRVAKELGLSVNSSGNVHVRVLSELVDRIMRIASRHYQIDVIGSTFKDTVSQSLITPLVEADAGGSGNLLVDECLNEAHNVYQICYGLYPSDHVTVNLKFSKVFYANEIMGMPVPFGSWTAVKDAPSGWSSSHKSSHSPVFAYLSELSKSRPLLCNIAIKNVDKEFAELLDIANGSSRRNWVTGQEAMLLAYYGDICIKEIFCAEAYQDLTERLDLNLPSEGVVGELSVSMGILAENHWTSLASERKVQIHGVERKIKPARAVWMRSWDRLMCWKAAKALKSAGYLVRGYGVGSVDVSVLPARLGPLMEFAAGMGLSSPLWLISAYDQYLETISGGEMGGLNERFRVEKASSNG